MMLSFPNDMPDTATICINCFQEKGKATTCPHCHYDEHHVSSHPLYLKPRTLLQNQYIIGRPLGQGGFGITYIGLDLWLQKRVAIKEYLPAALATRDFIKAVVIPIKKQEETFNQGLAQFIDEARNLAKFDHPNIVHVLNFFEENQTGYMVMEYLEGESPVECLNRSGGKVTVEKALSIILPLLDALIEVHQQHIYHRDISIQNIRITKEGKPVLIDFGAARHIIGENSRSLDLVLKHGYSPLEQYSGKGHIGAWTDIYACGALLYLMLSGQLPPAATDRYGNDTLIPLNQLPNLQVPDAISQAVMKALANDIADRFQTITAFKAALQGEIYIEPVTSQKPSSPKYSIRPFIFIFLIILAVLPTRSHFSHVSQKEEIALLLQQATQQWQAKQIYQPDDNNVYVTYQKILQLVDNHPKAKKGLEKVMDYFKKTALEQQDLMKRLTFIQQGLQLFPDDTDLLAFEKRTQIDIEQMQQQQMKMQKIQTLLTQAQQHFSANELKTTAQRYQEILSFDPKHEMAQQGLQQVAQRYKKIAQEKNSLFIVNQGLDLFPRHAGLLSLQQKLTQSIKKQNQIDKLLKQAQQQLKSVQLTEPKGNNAYETYQLLQQLAPQHPAIQTGFTHMANAYEKLAIKTKNEEKQLAYINKGLNIVPHHQGLLTLKRQLSQVETSIAPPQKIIVEKKIPVQQKIPMPSQPVEKVDSNVNTQKNVIQNLVRIAQQYLDNKQLEPAYQTYQNMLLIDANNKVAQAGLAKILESYIQYANSKKAQNLWKDSLAIIEEGLRFYPKNTKLLQLQTKVKQHIENKEKLPEKVDEDSDNNIIFTPSF